MSKQIDILNQPRSVAEFVEEVELLTREIQELYCSDSTPWIVGYSGGKDSTAALQLVWNAVSALPESSRTKTVYIISTDTLVENPIISAWVKLSLQRMEDMARDKRLPFCPHQLKPTVEDTFWVNLIGKGYPAPRPKFRWCTERLKIHPANRFIRNIIRENGDTILVLGMRRDESQKRSQTMKKHQRKRTRDRFSPNSSLLNSLVYSPVEDWTTEEVWLYLHQWQNPWGHSNKELFQIYRGATADNECPMVVDTSTPSCGSSRFGCWVCTLVERDKSMEAMILNDESKEWMQPLLDFRDELDCKTKEKMLEERNRRDFRRIWGGVQLFEQRIDDTKQTQIVNIPGPYIKSWREELLRRLLKTQMEVREKAPQNMKQIELISMEELSEIRRIWLEEKHEFDDTLPHIYREVTGDIFQDPRPNAGNSQLSSFEWDLLKDICEDDMELELLARLLDTERQYQTMSRRSGIINALEKIFDTSSRNQDIALQKAFDSREINTNSKKLRKLPKKEDKENQELETLEINDKDRELGDNYIDIDAYIEWLRQFEESNSELISKSEDTEIKDTSESDPTYGTKPSQPSHRVKAAEPSATYDTDNWAAAKFKQTP